MTDDLALFTRKLNHSFSFVSSVFESATSLFLQQHRDILGQQTSIIKLIKNLIINQIFKCRGVFRVRSNIYDEAFLQK